MTVHQVACLSSTTQERTLSLFVRDGSAFKRANMIFLISNTIPNWHPPERDSSVTSTSTPRQAVRSLVPVNVLYRVHYCVRKSQYGIEELPNLGV